MVKKVNGKAKWVLVKVEGVCSASSGIFILLLWWGGQRETPREFLANMSLTSFYVRMVGEKLKN